MCKAGRQNMGSGVFWCAKTYSLLFNIFQGDEIYPGRARPLGQNQRELGLIRDNGGIAALWSRWSWGSAPAGAPAGSGGGGCGVAMTIKHLQILGLFIFGFSLAGWKIRLAPGRRAARACRRGAAPAPSRCVSAHLPSLWRCKMRGPWGHVELPVAGNFSVRC